MAMLAMLSVPLATLGFTALAAVLPVGLAGPENAGPHGFSEFPTPSPRRPITTAAPLRALPAIRPTTT